MTQHLKARSVRFGLSIILIATMLPVVAAPVPVTAQSESGSLCTGDPTDNFYGPCGPSITIPAWSDAAGWNDPDYAEAIILFDLDGDGKDELVGRSPQGLIVNTWSADLGQWLPASDLSKPLPFSPGAATGEIQFGMLSENLRGAIALAGDGSGLETWTWNPGDGSVGSGYWSLLNKNGPFNNQGSSFFYVPAWFSTLQFVPEPLGGTEYGFIARGTDGIHFCAWQTDSNTWSCKLATSAFSDALVTDPNSTESWPNNLAEYYWDTIQLADLDAATPGPELFGLENSSQSLVIYGWDSGSRQFTSLNPSGNAPFWSPQGQWLNPLYSSTIQAVQLNGPDQPMQVIARGRNGLEWHSLNDSGCGGHTPPCWKNNTVGQGPLSDYSGYGQGQYAGTLRFVDLDGNGIDELIIRNPFGQLTSWGLHKNAGWYELSAFGPQLSSGPASDPLWSDQSYYQTIQTGVVSDDQRPTVIMRGKYGIRTFQYWSQSGWSRPYPYGFQSFGTQSETYAYDLVGDYLSLASGVEVRDEYSTANASVLGNYVTCLEQSIQAGTTMPPTETCDVTSSPTSPLSNPNGVTSEQWHAMAILLLAEIGQAEAVSTHFNVSTLEVISDTFFQEQVDLNDAINYLFPNPPDSGSGVSTSMFGLFVGLGEALSIVTGSAAANAGLHVFSAIVGSIGSMQSKPSVYDTKIEDLQGQIDSTASEAIDRNQALFQYISQDRGLLSLYGSLIDDGYWQLDAGGLNAAESMGQYNNTFWIYQTMLPLYWEVGVCSWHDNCGSSNHSFLEQWGVNVSGPWWAALGQINSPYDNIPAQGDTLSSRVFGSVQDTCQIGGTDPSTSWDYSNHDPNAQQGAGCNLGLSTTPLLYFENGWVFTCLVFSGSNVPVDAYNCGQGPPDGYGPPGS